MVKNGKLLLLWLFLIIFTAVFLLSFGNFTNNGAIFFASPPDTDPLTRLSYMFAQWDGGNYYQISQSGYTDTYLFAFFPFYPSIITILSDFSPPILTGLFLSLVFLSVFLSVFIRYAQKLAYGLDSQTAVLSVLCFPSAFILISFYPESLFLALTIGASYLFFVRKDYFPAVVFASIASITRVQGIIFLVLIIFYLFKTKTSFFLKITYLLILLLPLGLYLQFQANLTGSPLVFIQAQTFWQRFSFSTLTFELNYLGLITLANLAAFLSALALFFYKRQILSRFDQIYLFILLILPLLTFKLESYPRYLLSAYPIFILIAKTLNTKVKKIVTFSILFLLQVIFFTLFVTGHWVF